MTPTSESEAPVASIANSFVRGDFATVALQGAREDWRTYAALGLIGNTTRALEGLRQFEGVEVRFYEAVTQWIDGQDEAAIRGLNTCESAHAQQLLALIRKPKIHVLAQCDRGSQWDLVSSIQNDKRFEVTNVGFSPRDKSNRVYGDVRQLFDVKDTPDFYIAKMVEWHLLPPNLQELPCPIFGHTADYDLHIQTIQPWLALFDELLTTDHTEWRDVSQLTNGPVTVFPKAFGISKLLPEIEPSSRPLDAFISGTTLHPYHPDKARLLHQVLRRTDLRVQMLEGFLALGPYFKILNSTRTAFTYIRHPGGMPTRGMEALGMGAAIAVQKESVLRAYMSENEGVVSYDSEGADLPDVISDISRHWDIFEPRAQRGALALRRDFSADRIAQQYFRFLTFLAAKPRGPRSVVPVSSLRQKRVVFCKGWAWHPSVGRSVRQRSTRAWAEDHAKAATPDQLIDIARELVLEHASAAYGPAARTIHANFGVRLTPDASTLDNALEIYRVGMQRFPRCLVLRFNAIRSALYLGQPHQVAEALGWARETLALPTGDWEVKPSEDVFPWDFFSQLFNYRAYFDRCTDYARTGEDVSSQLIRLQLASIAYHVGCYPAEGTEQNKVRVAALQAVKWDSEFPFYSLHAARVLMSTRSSEHDDAAVDLLIPLVKESMLCLQATELLSEMKKEGRTRNPEVERCIAEGTLAKDRVQATVTGRDDWSTLPLRPSLQIDGDAIHPCVSQTTNPSTETSVGSASSQKVLYLCLEFTQWQHARKLAYPAGLGLEEGFQAQGIECVTMPSICGLSKEAREAWQKAIQQRCAHEHFDQVWFELVHSEWDEEFLAWVNTVAPVRVGLIMESLRYEPDVYAQAPQLLNRHAQVEKRLRHATHVLCIDEADAQEFQQRGQPALWWPQAVPARFIQSTAKPMPDRRGVFLGSIYGNRANWLGHPDLLGWLTFDSQAPEDATALPTWFDDMQRQWESLLLAGGDNWQDGLSTYMETWRRIRSDCFERWIKGLQGCGSVVNLPSYVRGYAGRVYEAMAAGRPTLSWEIPDRPRTRSLFREGKEILLFKRDDPASLLEALQKLQSDPAFARELAERGIERLRSCHTVERRVEQVMHWIATQQAPNFDTPKPPHLLSHSRSMEKAEVGRKTASTALVQTLAKVRYEQADMIGAGQALDVALQDRGCDAVTWLLRADIARRLADASLFRKCWENAVSFGASDVEVCRQLAGLCTQHGHVDLAARLSQLLFKSGGEDLGSIVAFIQHVRWTEGSPHASGDLSLDRSWVETLVKQMESATEKVTSDLSAGVTASVVSLGDLSEAKSLRAAGQLEQACSSVQKSILARPFHPEGWLLLSNIALEAGDLTLARQSAEAALRLTPQWKEAKNQNAKVSKQKKSTTRTIALPAEVTDLLKPATRLTVCVIVKNEERFLGKCLASIKGVADQLIVVDTGSTDRTVDIAREAGAEIHTFAWCDDFSAARNAALQHARGDWILQLDADEELVPETRDKLRSALQDSSTMAYRLPLADVGKEKEGFHHVPRLFRNAPGIHYRGRVHEHAFGSLEEMRKQWGLQNAIGKAQILHHGYTDQVVKDRSKVQRNLRLLQRAIEETPNDVSLLMSYGLDMVRSGQMDSGLEEYAKAFRCMGRAPMDSTPPELRERLLTLMSSHLVKAQRFQTVIEISESAQATASGPTASLHLLFGLAHFVQQNLEKATSHLKQCIAKRQQPALSPLLPDILGGGPKHLLAMTLAKMGNHAEAEEHFRASLAETPNAIGVQMDFAKHLKGTGQWVPALEQLHAIVASRPSELMAWRLGAEISLSDPAFRDFSVDWTSEAIKAFPRDPEIVEARGEALLLSGEFAQAAEMWAQIRGGNDPRSEAAYLFCRLQVGSLEVPSKWALGREANISQEFCGWFRKVVGYGHESAIQTLARRLDHLRSILPTAAEVISAVLKEAQAA